jgi:hypothetical protein
MYSLLPPGSASFSKWLCHAPPASSRVSGKDFQPALGISHLPAGPCARGGGAGQGAGRQPGWAMGEAGPLWGAELRVQREQREQREQRVQHPPALCALLRPTSVTAQCMMSDSRRLQDIWRAVSVATSTITASLPALPSTCGVGAQGRCVSA